VTAEVTVSTPRRTGDQARLDALPHVRHPGWNAEPRAGHVLGV